MKKILANFNLSFDPFKSFSNWYNAAKEIDLEPEAFTLATANQQGIPSARMLLFKGIIQDQFSWYSHSSSRKGQELAINPHAAMVFYWPKAKRQVRISGRVSPMSKDETLKHFKTRNKLSQIASYISQQSEIIDSPNILVENFQKACLEFQNKEVPLPTHWSGYLLKPSEFYFFQYGEHRLNHRFYYSKNQEIWSVNCLQP